MMSTPVVDGDVLAALGILAEAVRTKSVVTCSYRGKSRVLEPQCVGIGHRGTPLVRVHQPRGGSATEPLFNVSEMRDIVVLDRHFLLPGPNYKRGDSMMGEIIAEL
jgi:hypothetical protein